MITKLLIANRGEIACRIIRTAKQMGIKTVAVYSDADVQSQHVKQADEAIYIGAAPSAESYLKMDTLIAAAKRTGATAVHPGYGFLAENEAFAQKLADNQLIFVGPPASAIEAMGSKSAAKSIMEKAGVPLVPGYHGDNQDEAFLLAESEKIGFPVLLKAAYGGGGKGMRIVHDASEFSEAFAGAKREAQASFGNDRMLVEKYIVQPRHIEIQVFCDQHGNAVYLAERDCSVQRRHQKVIEEAPAPGLTQEVRDAMGQAAVKAAQAIGYVGAGTVEFLYDHRGHFYFMEMNTRLQVEHPITEMITGTDLVEWQLRIAVGKELPLKQDNVRIDGHAFEARIYAENADDNFMPSTGTLEHLVFPAESSHVRIDTGVTQGDAVTPYYDPMIAKLIVWDKDRATALRQLQLALKQTQITGLHTNTDYIHRIASHPAFETANVSTHFIDDYHDDLLPKEQNNAEEMLALLITLVAKTQTTPKQTVLKSSTQPTSPWASITGWNMNAPAQVAVSLRIQDEVQHFTVQVIDVNQKIYELALQDNEIIRVQLFTGSTATINDLHMHYDFVASSDDYHLFTAEGMLQAQVYNPIADLEQDNEADGMVAPMNGTIIEVRVAAGDTVSEGNVLVIMEAMKMEHSIRAPHDGTVAQVFYQAGDLVEHGAELVALQDTQ